MINKTPYYTWYRDGSETRRVDRETTIILSYCIYYTSEPKYIFIDTIIMSIYADRGNTYSLQIIFRHTYFTLIVLAKLCPRVVCLTGRLSRFMFTLAV